MIFQTLSHYNSRKTSGPPGALQGIGEAEGWFSQKRRGRLKLPPRPRGRTGRCGFPRRGRYRLGLGPELTSVALRQRITPRF